MSLFSRISTDPVRWAALWRVLEPYGGRLIADCDHYPWIEQPEPFRQILHSWRTKAH